MGASDCSVFWEQVMDVGGRPSRLLSESKLKTLYGRKSSAGTCTAFGRTGPAAAVCRVREGA
jgi:hypothetical protein